MDLVMQSGSYETIKPQLIMLIIVFTLYRLRVPVRTARGLGKVNTVINVS